MIIRTKAPWRVMMCDGKQCGVMQGRPMASIESGDIMLSYLPAKIRINGKWFEACDLQRAEYLEKQFNKSPEEMDMQ